MKKSLPINVLVRFIMRVSLIQIILFSCLISISYAGTTTAQILQSKLTIDSKNNSLRLTLKQIEKETGARFLYNSQILHSIGKVSIHASNQALGEVLEKLLVPLGIFFEVEGKQIILSRGKSIESLSALDRLIFSWQIEVSGIVKDEDGMPLPGVNILLKGTTIGTATDSEGKFSLSVPDENAELVFTFIGFEKKEIVVGTRTTFDVTLTADAKALQEVVIVGYGTQKKSDLTGSVGSIKAEEIQERQLPSVNQALAGRIAGVAVNTNSGRPGGQTNVRIRGSSSISASNNPLYVVDGVVMPVGTQTGNSNAIDYINPADIASIEVLKDASATAIYGARGANGVILITTKRGSNNGGRITYDMQLSVPTIGPNRVEMLNAQEFLDTEELAWKNASTYDPSQVDADGNFTGKVDPLLNRTDPLLFDSEGNPLYDTDWLKESTQNKLSQNHQLSFTGGNDKNSYGAFVGYRDENGLLLNSYLKRYSVRFVYDSQIKDWIKVGGSLSYNNQDENLVDTGTGGLNSVRMITEALPFLPVKYPDGSYSHNSHYPTMEGGRNPVDQLVNNKYQLLTQNTMGNLYANIRLAEGLELRSTVGINIVARERDEYTSRPPLQGPDRSPLPDGSKGYGLLRSDRETFWSFENYLTYTKRYNEIHSLTALLGVSWQETNIFGFQASGTTYLSDFLSTNNLGSAKTINTPASNRARFAFNSYFGRINYSLKDKYLLTVTGRMDGSSKFGESNKFAFFPSAALAWRVSEENFISKMETISNLKLRLSYGYTGNSEINTYSALPILSAGYVSVFNDSRVTGVGISRLGNDNLKWEKTAQSDIGLELGLFENKIVLEGDVYYKKTTDMLLDAPLPQSSGYANITKNIGSLENKGFELSINTENISTDALLWTTNFNISANRNKVLSLATSAPIFGVGNPNFTNQTGIIKVGEPVGSFWGLVRLGTWNTDEADEAIKYNYRGGKPILPGDIKYLDVNGDYLINDLDRQIIGNAYPKFYGSFINSFQFKQFDLLIDFQYSYGNDVLNMTHHSGEDRVSIANSFNSVLNAWTPDNQNTPIAAIRDTRAGYVTNVDTHWVEDGSFIRGRNLLLGYTFSSALAERWRLSKLRIYVSVQNYMLLTKYGGNDPEVTTYENVFAQGQTFFDYPKPTIYMLGVSVGL